LKVNGPALSYAQRTGFIKDLEALTARDPHRHRGDGIDYPSFSSPIRRMAFRLQVLAKHGDGVRLGVAGQRYFRLGWPASNCPDTCGDESDYEAIVRHGDQGKEYRRKGKEERG
jgi:hypothetical protein